MPDYIPTKVLLHDPEGTANAKSLYPITAVTALVATVADDSPYITVTGTSKIKYQYLEIVGDNGKVSTSYLPITFTDGGKISNSDLDIFTTEGGNTVIKSELLPSFVDDVVSVPVINNINDATGDLVILVTTSGNSTTYNFYKKTGNTYTIGGGETGKIYISDSDSAIYRCVSGSTTVAAKISENPYAVATTKTNGVYLDTTNGTLTAKADKATANSYGTVQISQTATNNVKLTVNDGVIAASAGTAGPTNVGVVYAVSTEAQASTLASEYGDTYVVPNIAYVSAAIEDMLFL